jgi:hypothetical protein
VAVGAFAWLGLEDALEPCPVAVVLNGDHPARADTAAALYQARVTREIWLTNDPRSGGGADPDTGTSSNVKRLTGRGVPADAIRVVEGAATGTRAELRAVRTAAQHRRVPCLLAVTSPPHAARLRVVWWRLGGAAPRLVVRHARAGRYAGGRAYATEFALTLGALVGSAR